jgi:hypothetical protein
MAAKKKTTAKTESATAPTRTVATSEDVASIEEPARKPGPGSENVIDADDRPDPRRCPRTTGTRATAPRRSTSRPTRAIRSKSSRASP